ncbi:MAG: hypothetical protein JWN13_2627 [Betaproteobacteria bacterium]|jgi:hypothetical protein|nr:hypothetical protein [Betaproteobacteria bacterium]
MKKSAVILLVAALGLALIAGLRLAVPGMFVMDDAAVSAPVLHPPGPGEAGASAAAPTDLESTSSDAFDALLYATASKQSGLSENPDGIDLALQSGASKGYYDTEPNGTGGTPTSSGGGARGGGSSIGYPPSSSASGQFPFGSGFGSGGFPSGGAGSAPVFPNAAGPNAAAVDDLGALVDVPSDVPHSELPGGSGTTVAELRTTNSASGAPIPEPPICMLLFFALGLLWVTRVRRARAPSNDRSM